MAKLGDRARCQRCGGKIIVIKDPRVISLSAALWTHVSGFRRLMALHQVVPPREV